MASLGSILVGNTTTALTSSTGVGGTVGTTPYLESIAGTDDATSYIEETSNSSVANASVYMAVDNFPADLGNVDTLTIQVRYNHITVDANLTWDGLSCRIYKADLSTALTDELVIHAGYNTSAWASTAVLDFVNEDTAASKADWDGAVIYFYYDKTKNKGGNSSAGMAITAAEISGTYTAAVAGGGIAGPLVGSAMTDTLVNGGLVS